MKFYEVTCPVDGGNAFFSSNDPAKTKAYAVAAYARAKQNWKAGDPAPKLAPIVVVDRPDSSKAGA